MGHARPVEDGNGYRGAQMAAVWFWSSVQHCTPEAWQRVAWTGLLQGAVQAWRQPLCCGILWLWPRHLARPALLLTALGKFIIPLATCKHMRANLSQALISITDAMAQLQRKLQELSEKYQSLQAGK